MKLYTSSASGNAYKCDLLLVLLGVKYESIALNLAANESRTASFLAWMRRIQALNGYVHMDGIARV